METVPASHPLNLLSPERGRQETVLISWILGSFHTSRELTGSHFDLHHPEPWHCKFPFPLVPSPALQIQVGSSLTCAKLFCSMDAKTAFHGAGAYWTTSLPPSNAFLNQGNQHSSTSIKEINALVNQACNLL